MADVWVLQNSDKQIAGVFGSRSAANRSISDEDARALPFDIQEPKRTTDEGARNVEVPVEVRVEVPVYIPSDSAEGAPLLQALNDITEMLMKANAPQQILTAVTNISAPAIERYNASALEPEQAGVTSLVESAIEDHVSTNAELDAHNPDNTEPENDVVDSGEEEVSADDAMDFLFGDDDEDAFSQDEESTLDDAEADIENGTEPEFVAPEDNSPDEEPDFLSEVETTPAEDELAVDAFANEGAPVVDVDENIDVEEAFDFDALEDPDEVISQEDVAEEEINNSDSDDNNAEDSDESDSDVAEALDDDDNTEDVATENIEESADDEDDEDPVFEPMTDTVAPIDFLAPNADGIDFTGNEDDFGIDPDLENEIEDGPQPVSAFRRAKEIRENTAPVETKASAMPAVTDAVISLNSWLVSAVKAPVSAPQVEVEDEPKPAKAKSPTRREIRAQQEKEAASADENSDASDAVVI